MGNLFQFHIGRQLDRRAFATPRLLDAATQPLNGIGLDAVIVLEDAAYPDVGGDLVLGQADALAFQIGWGLDAAISPDVDTGMTEHPRHKRRHTDVMALVTRDGGGMAGQGQLANIELVVLEGAMKAFFGRHCQGQQIHPINRRAAIENGLGAIVVAHSKGQAELGHERHPVIGWRR
jgi:hypothetical protein